MILRERQMDLSNENVIHVKENGIEYLQFRKLREYKEKLTHAFTMGVENDYRMPLYNSPTNILTFEQILPAFISSFKLTIISLTSKFSRQLTICS